MTNPNNNENFLSSEEKYLFKELKLVQKIMSDAEATYSKWEDWFMMAEGILLVAAGQLLLNQTLYPISIVIGVFGIILSILFFLIQQGSHIYATGRYNRRCELEKLLSKNLKNKKGIFMGIIQSQDKEKEKHKWYRGGLTTWSVRKYVPILFIIVWISMVIFTIYLVWRKPQIKMDFVTQASLLSVVRSYNRRVSGSDFVLTQFCSLWSQTSDTRQPLCEINS